MKRILLLLALLTAVPAQAASPIIYFGTHSKDLTAQGLITQALTVGNTGSQLTVSSSGGLTAPSFIQANGQIFTIGGNNIVSNQNFIGRNLYLKDVFDSHQVGIQSPSAGMTADYNVTLPPTQGSATQYMQNDGSGNLTWVSPVTASPTAYSSGLQAVVAMGSPSGFLPAGHRMTSADIPSGLSTSQYSWFPLTSSTTTTDQNGTNAKNLVNGTNATGCNAGGPTVFTGADFMGTASNAAAVLGGAGALCSTDAYYKLTTTDSYSFGAWFKATSWNAGSFQMLITNEYDSANRGFDLSVGNDGYIYFEDGPVGVLASQVSVAYQHGFSAGSWHWLGQTYDATTKMLRAFVDGQYVGTVGPITKSGVSASQIFHLGARNNTPSNYFTGNIADFFFIKSSAALTDDQMHMVYSKTIAHNKGIAPESQLWSGSWGNSGSTVNVPLSTSYVVNRTNNTLWADFTNVGVGNFVDFRMQNVGQYGTALVPNSTYDSGVLSAAPSTTIAHGLGARPANIVYQYETTTGHFTPIQGSNFCEADATNLYCDWTGLSVSASNRLEIIAGGVPLLSAVPLADATTAGLINGAAAQTIGGAKTFSGQVTASGGIVANVGAQINKQYVVGTAYTNGTPTLTSSQAGFSVTRGVLVPYQTFDGAWRLKFNINTSFTLASTALGSVTFSGVAFNSSASQSCSAYCSNTSTTPRCYTGGSGAISFDFASATSVNGVIVSGDVELASKPTWAD